MISVIKSLNPKQRLFALIFTTIISAVVSLSTVYLKTDDCKGLSDQYTALVKNQTDLMGINNTLLSQYNQARRDLETVHSYLGRIDSLANITYTNTQSTTTAYVPIEKTHIEYVYVNDSIAPLAFAKDNVETPLPKPKTETKKTVVKAPKILGNLLDSLSTITEKYKK